MREHVLKLMKEQMYHAIERLSYESIQEVVDDIANCFAIIQATSELPDLNGFTSPTNKITNEEAAKEVLRKDTPDLPIESNEIVNEEEKEDSPNGPFRFERKFKGGFLPGIEAFVPEKTVRELELKHGDTVYAKLLRSIEDGPDHYEYELAEHKHEKQPEERIEIDYAIVDYDPSINRYVASKTSDGSNIRYNDAPYTIVISEEDARDLKLRKDDIVDIVLSKNNPNYSRVIWRYSVEEAEDGSRPRPSGFYKKKDNDDYVTGSLKETLKGKTICVMGYEPGKTDFQTEVERRGGKFVWLSGRETSPTLSSTMSKSNAVILMLGHVGHAGTIFAVDYCKRNGIPSGSLHTFGRSSFIAKAEELVEESK